MKTKTKDCVIKFRLTATENTMLKKMAEVRGITVSDFIRSHVLPVLANRQHNKGDLK